MVLTHAAAMSTKTKKPAGKASRSAIADVVAREYTIHLHKRVRPTDPRAYAMMDWIQVCRRADIRSLASRCYIQEAGTKSYQRD
jgi:hypothetical protein